MIKHWFLWIIYFTLSHYIQQLITIQISLLFSLKFLSKFLSRKVTFKLPYDFFIFLYHFPLKTSLSSHGFEWWKGMWVLNLFYLKKDVTQWRKYTIHSLTSTYWVNKQSLTLMTIFLLIGLYGFHWRNMKSSRSFI